MRKCKIDDCSIEPQPKRRVCESHRKYLARYGSLIGYGERASGRSWNRDATPRPGYKDTSGYIIVLIKGKRIHEHRYVMEQRLGRKLLPGENVHHINGVRDDNRDENLELWSTSQPKGQRVEDKLAWAKEIIELYG